MTEEPGARRDALWLALIGLAFAAFGTLFALYLTFSDGEWSFLVFGRLLMTGEIRLFQEEITGRRLPLPSYVIGVSQLMGPSVLLGRLWSVAIGLAAVYLTFRLGRVAGGRAAGFLAALFLITNPLVVGFFASAAYHSLSAVLILGGVLAIVAWPGAAGRLVGMACFSAQSLSRAHLVPMIPFIFLYLLYRARSLRERVLLVLVAALPPLVFVLWTPDHLKVLAYVPGLSRLVEPLGYRSLLEMGAEAMLPDAQPMDGVVWFLKRYVFWVLATAGLAAAAAATWLARRDRVRLRPGGPLLFVAVLSLYTLAAQAAMIPMYLKVVAAWSATFAALWAVVLGTVAARLLEPGRAPAAIRGGVAALLAAVFLLSPSLAHHAAMPHPPPPWSTLALLDADAAAIRAVVPKGSRVFLIGSPIPAYRAEVRPYLQQILGVWTFVPSTDDFAVTRSGLWGPRQVEEWLGHDAQYALIESGRLPAIEALPAYRPVVARVRSLLAERFERVGHGGRAGVTPTFDIYRRRSIPRP